MAAETLTQFDYLLNALELAAQADKPAEHSYGAKRQALFAYVRGLERDATRYGFLCEQEHSDDLFIASGRNGTYGECGHSSFGGFKDIADKAVDAAMRNSKVKD